MVATQGWTEDREAMVVTVGGEHLRVTCEGVAGGPRASGVWRGE